MKTKTRQPWWGWGLGKKVTLEGLGGFSPRGKGLTLDRARSTKALVHSICSKRCVSQRLSTKSVSVNHIRGSRVQEVRQSILFFPVTIARKVFAIYLITNTGGRVKPVDTKIMESVIWKTKGFFLGYACPKRFLSLTHSSANVGYSSRVVLTLPTEMNLATKPQYSAALAIKDTLDISPEGLTFFLLAFLLQHFVHTHQEDSKLRSDDVT